MATAGGGVTVTLVGEKQLLAKLFRIPRVDARRAIRKGSRAGAKVILPVARSNAPRKAGQLRKSLRVRAAKRSRKFIGAVVATREGFFKGETFYGAFQEFGWKTGKRGSTGRKQIPGKHFLERAADSKGSQALFTASTIIGSEIEQSARR